VVETAARREPGLGAQPRLCDHARRAGPAGAAAQGRAGRAAFDGGVQRWYATVGGEGSGTGSRGISRALAPLTHTMKFIAVATLLAAMSAACTQAQSTMKSTNSAKDALQCKPDEKSACGLPSHVVIDMSKAKVQHTDAEWMQLLSPRQFQVARKQGTEPPFQNEYWDNHEDGVY